MSTSTSFRLCSRAPRTRTKRRRSGSTACILARRLNAHGSATSVAPLDARLPDQAGTRRRRRRRRPRHPLDPQQFADADGSAERLGISSAGWPLFGLLWPSGARLAARLAARPVTEG